MILKGINIGFDFYYISFLPRPIPTGTASSMAVLLGTFGLSIQFVNCIRMLHPIGCHLHHSHILSFMRVPVWAWEIQTFWQVLKQQRRNPHSHAWP